MTDFTMDCLGSLIIYNEGKGYCASCQLRDRCASEVAANRKRMEEALGQPVYEEGGKFWLAAKKRSQQRAALAYKLSTVKSVEAAPPRPVAAVTPASIITPYEASRKEGLPVKVRQALEKWIQKGITPESICDGINPFASVTGLKFPTLLADVVIARGTGMTKAELRKAIAQEMQDRGEPVWSDPSIQSNVNIVAGAFAACGIQIVKESS